MKKYLITMGGTELGWSRHNDEGIFRDYQKEAERLMESAKSFGFETIIYDNKFIENLPYYEYNKRVLRKTSFGFCHKAICLYETMNIMKDGDIVFFVDSNHIVQASPEIFITIAVNTGFFVRDHIWHIYPIKDWCRRDTLVNMGLDTERYWEAVQMQANIVGFCKNDLSMKFITEWKDSCLDYNIMFGNGIFENFPTFKEHRHDQIIFSLLVEKYNIPYLIREKNVWGENIMPEVDPISPDNPVDNRHRKNQDRGDIR